MNAVLMAWALVLGGTTYYVDASGVPPGTGTQPDPFTSIAYLFTQVPVTSTTTILVAPGVYRENLALPGSAFTMKSTDGPDVTIIESAQDNTPVVLSFATSGALIEGFTLRGATGSQGAGLRSEYATSITLRRCILTDNHIGFRTSYDNAFDRCTIAGNTIGIFFDPLLGDFTQTGMLSSIIYGNTVGVFDTNNGWGNFLGNAYGIVEPGLFPGLSNVQYTDPLFWDAANGDFHLRPGSPGIDMGDPDLMDPDGSVMDVGPLTYDPTYAPDPVVYCTAKTSSEGCVAMIGATGANVSVSSTAPALVTAANVPAQKSGLLLLGLAPAAIPFQGGWFCMQFPVQRTALQFSGGTSATCSGSLETDVNARLSAGTLPWVTAGVTLHGQFWFRDPGDPFLSALSDAIAVGVTE